MFIVKITIVLVIVYLCLINIYFTYGDFNILSVIHTARKKALKKFNLGKIY